MSTSPNQGSTYPIALLEALPRGLSRGDRSVQDRPGIGSDQDPFAEEDFEGHAKITAAVGDKARPFPNARRGLWGGVVLGPA